MSAATADNLFNEQQKAAVIGAIEYAEMQTSGEIRLHLENYCRADVLDRAAYIFQHLEMHKTEERNGVLFYLAVKDKKFAILGDVGINMKVPTNFWDTTKSAVLKQFVLGNYVEGLTTGIQMAGDQLKAFFPRQNDDVNELSNDISFG